MRKTPFCKQYRITTPFIGAGMGFISMPRVVAAVSNAGGLGILGASPGPPEYLKTLIDQTRALTTAPFGVDLIHETSPTLGEFVVQAHIDICAAERVPIVLFFWNLPPREWIEQLQTAGCKVWMTVGTLDGARQAADAGIDALIVQGSGAGGHNKSSVGIFNLLPSVADAVPQLPLIAAGGIADARGVAAAIMLGADGVCVGTRLIASTEVNAHDEYKQRVVGAEAEDTTVTNIFGPEWPDQPMRVIKNRIVLEWQGRDARTPPADPTRPPIGSTVMQGQTMPLPKFSAFLATPDTEADFDELCLAAGESVGQTRDIKPVAQIVEEMMGGAEQIMERTLIRFRSE